MREKNESIIGSGNGWLVPGQLYFPEHIWVKFESKFICRPQNVCCISKRLKNSRVSTIRCFAVSYLKAISLIKESPDHRYMHRSFDEFNKSIVASYGAVDLGQLWFRQWFAGFKSLTRPLLPYHQLGPLKSIHIKIHYISSNKMHLKWSSVKWRPFICGLKTIDIFCCYITRQIWGIC